tara:strand:- start:4969 stop:6468 length:1500 start_codon:yes stop_codon:yes gene_type:complete
MSTKINIRSPFFLSLTEPTQTFGIFDCNTALLSNFAVRSSGFIDNPLPSKGVIIDQSVFSFPANSGSSTIPRSVTYTIVIPANYTNSSDSTIDCVQTFNQPFQTAQENPSDNNTCPTVNTQPSNLSGITAGAAQVIDVDTLFTAGSEAIGTYNVKRISGSSSITAVISGTGTNVICTIESSTACVTGQFLFQAINTSGSCEALTNAFSFSTAGCQAFDCDDPDFIADSGKIYQDGSVKKSVYQLGGLSLNKLLYGSTDISTSLTVGANNTGSDRTIVLTYRFNIPLGYTNSGTFDCNIPYTQKAVETLLPFACADADITAPFISDQGSIQNPTDKVGLGTYVSHSPAGFQTVTTPTPRTIYFTVTAPSSGFSNNGVTIPPCPVPVLQPALIPVVGTTGLYLSRGFASVDDICKLQRPGVFFETYIEAKTTASSFTQAQGSFSQIITVGGSVLQGNGQIFVITPTLQKVDGTVIFSFLKIEGGVVQATGKHICTYDGGFV